MKFIGAIFFLLMPCVLPLLGGDGATAPKFVKLKDGRHLSYQEFGTAYGKPVFYFHGLNGSRLEAGLIDPEARKCGIRLISVDRPGIGHSTYCPDRTVLDWVDDFECLVSKLGLSGQKVGIFAVSGGSPYGCAVASKKGHMVSRLSLVSPYAPYSSLKLQRSVGRGGAVLVSNAPNVGITFFESRKKPLQKRPERALKQLTQNWYKKDTELVFANQEAQVDNLLQVIHQGGSGVVKDIQLHNSDWQIDFSCIKGTQVKIWTGSCDPIAPSNMPKFYKDQIKGSTIFVGKGEGHITMVKSYASRILSEF